MKKKNQDYKMKEKTSVYYDTEINDIVFADKHPAYGYWLDYKDGFGREISNTLPPHLVFIGYL